MVDPDRTRCPIGSVSPAISATTLRPKSIPDVTPPAVITLPSLTMRGFSYVAPTSGSSFQCLVARRPLSNPATPSTKAPVHTEVTYFAVPACRRTNCIVSRPFITPTMPLLPPGIQIKSRDGQFAKVRVGTRLYSNSGLASWANAFETAFPLQRASGYPSSQVSVTGSGSSWPSTCS
jgi:hypothetical protein